MASPQDDDYLKISGADETSVGTRSTTYHDAVKSSPVAANPVPVETRHEHPDVVKKQQSASTAKKNEEKDAAMGEVTFDEHRMSPEDVAKKFHSDVTHGLSSAQAAIAMQRDGPNEMTEIKGKSEFIKYMLCLFGDGFSLLLWLGSALCFAAFIVELIDSAGGLPSEAYNLSSDTPPDNLFLGSVLLLVVVITGTFQYFQEKKSSDTMKGFLKAVPVTCSVVRDGEMNNCHPRELVVGDVIEVGNGDRIPADIRIITSAQMKVDNASLTGESEPQRRQNAISPEDRGIDSNNLAFYTTQVVNGSARGIVVKTGDRTVIGVIQTLVGGTEKKQTPIRKELIHFIHLISGVAISLGVSFFAIALGMNVYSEIRCVIFLIAIIVANVPEGLLATVTVTLTIAATKMAQHKVLIKTLESVETLGSTSCICSDKTGTLTQNKMTVVHVMFDNQVWKCQESMRSKITGDDENDTIDLEHKSWHQLWVVGQLCNVAFFMYNKDKATGVPTSAVKEPGNQQERLTKGDASESAILKVCDRISEQMGPAFTEAEQFRADHKKILNIPFNSTVKFAASVHDFADKDALQFVLKGAPERVILRCDKILIKGEAVPMTAAHLETFEEKYAALGSAGERVLGFAYEDLDTQAFPKDFAFEDDMPFNGLCSDTHKSMVFVGLMALIDPPRDAVPKAVTDCQSGGIQVIMVTGDHPETAKAIAKSIGIIHAPTAEDEFAAENPGLKNVQEVFNALPDADKWARFKRAKAQVCKGGDLDGYTEEQLDLILDHDELVFARTSPAQKLRIVQGCQRNGKIVAVTGDGVNDSPALKAADIGCAMGIAGSDVAKDAADMILLNDDFSSIVEGVKQGRIVFDNLKKSIAYTLTSNIPEIAPFLFMIIFRVPLPLSTIMILAIDLGTDMYPAISMAYEGPESDIMDRKPRNPKTDNLVTLKLLQYTYMQIGIIQACAGFFSYFVVLSNCGFLPSLLFDDSVGPNWEEIKVGGSTVFDQYYSITDSYGQEHDIDSRSRLLQAAQTSYFVSIVVVQWADLIVCKTRVLSLFQQGMRNRQMNQALVFETLLAICLCYIPGMDEFFKTGPLNFVWWLPPISFSVLIFVYDELRKRFIRNDRKRLNFAKTGLTGWVEKTTYY